MGQFRPIDRWDGGAGWIADPDESIQRASHTVTGSAGQWLIDPVDHRRLDGWLADRGPVRGVVVALDRHTRDAETIAARHDVAIHIPDALRGIAESFEPPTKSLSHFEAATGWTVHPIIERRWWREYALVSPEGAVVRIPEAVGTAPHFRAPEELLGVHPLLRLRPPRGLREPFDPDRLLVGHGAGIDETASGVLRETLESARRRAPAAYLAAIRATIGD